MKYIKLLSIIIISALLWGCVSLAPTTITRNQTLDGYKYVYITPTAERNSVYGATYGGSYGAASSNSISPSELIAGYLMNLGYIRIPEIKQDNAKTTFIVNYGDGNMRYEGLNHAIEVTLQLINAETNELICVAKADAIGNTDSDAIRNAINKCLNVIFQNNNPIINP